MSTQIPVKREGDAVMHTSPAASPATPAEKNSSEETAQVSSVVATNSALGGVIGLTALGAVFGPLGVLAGAGAVATGAGVHYGVKHGLISRAARSQKSSLAKGAVPRGLGSVKRGSLPGMGGKKNTGLGGKTGARGKKNPLIGAAQRGKGSGLLSGGKNTKAGSSKGAAGSALKGKKSAGAARTSRSALGGKSTPGGKQRHAPRKASRSRMWPLSGAGALWGASKAAKGAGRFAKGTGKVAGRGAKKAGGALKKPFSGSRAGSGKKGGSLFGDGLRWGKAKTSSSKGSGGFGSRWFQRRSQQRTGRLGGFTSRVFGRSFTRALVAVPGALLASAGAVLSAVGVGAYRACRSSLRFARSRFSQFRTQRRAQAEEQAGRYHFTDPHHGTYVTPPRRVWTQSERTDRKSSTPESPGVGVLLAGNTPHQLPSTQQERENTMSDTTEGYMPSPEVATESLEAFISQIDPASLRHMEQLFDGLKEFFEAIQQGISEIPERASENFPLKSETEEYFATLATRMTEFAEAAEEGKTDFQAAHDDDYNRVEGDQRNAALDVSRNNE